MYENRSQPLISRAAYIRRQAFHILAALGVVAVSLAIGVAGYHGLESMSWIDSLLNASMILGGMGPVTNLATDAGKLFASAYALYSGVVFLVVAGVIFAPAFHRVLHHFHVELESGESAAGAGKGSEG